MPTTSGGLTAHGLRLKTYKAVYDLKAEDRDSHHTVQYLLFEYLHNYKLAKPFPLLGKTDPTHGVIEYPGISRTGNLVTTIDGAKTIAVQANFDVPGQRGGPMTAVSLSRHTHQSGIHYKTESADDGADARPT